MNPKPNRHLQKFTAEAEPANERIVHVETWLMQIGAWISAMVIGYGLSVAMIAAAISSGVFEVIICALPMLLLGQLGVHGLFLRPRDCIIVTIERVALRGRNFLFLPYAKDIPLEKIKKLTVVDFQVNGAHSHYRLQVDVDTGKRKSKVVTWIPNNAHALANAILTAQGIQAKLRPFRP